MATFTKTISNTLHLYGVEPHSLWGVFVWGTDVWGQRDVQWTDYKNISNTLTISSTRTFKVAHQVSDNLILDTIISRQFSYQIRETLNIGSAISAVYRLNNGWYSQSGDTINALIFPVSNFSHVVNPTDNWTIVPNSTTNWSNL